MVRIRYLAKQPIEEQGQKRFMLVDKGSYFYKNDQSKYRGWISPIKHGKMLKTVDAIIPNAVLHTIEIDTNNVREIYDKGSILYSFSQDGLLLTTDFRVELDIYLDVRALYDYDTQGRIYSIDTSQNRFIVTYEKYANNILEELYHQHVILIQTPSTISPIQQWKEFHFDEDKARGSNPTSLYTFHACSVDFEPGSLLIQHGSNEKEIKQVHHEQKSYFVGYNIEAKQKIAVRKCVQTLDELETPQGYFAGLPWFHHIWTRDEAIALGGPIVLKQYTKTKFLLLNHINQLHDDGRLANRVPHSELGTADGTGWVFYRLFNLFKRNVLTKQDKDVVAKQLQESIRLHKKHHITDHLISNGPNETWMDTSHDHDTREGFRIEIQSLWLSMLDFGSALNIVSSNEYEKTKQAIKKHFYQKPLLYDGKDDPTIRPNIFFAYYVTPQLLDPKEWDLVFEKALEKLWLDWGGLATIDKSHSLYTDLYTGENNISYHRGDSWFFVNNIAAICMYRLNKKKYNDFITKILHASVQDILFDGIPGRPSELSDAKSQHAGASYCQLWSASTFIELIDTLH